MKEEIDELIEKINTSWEIHTKSCARLLELVFPIFCKMVDNHRMFEAKAIFDKMPDSIIKAYLGNYLREKGKSF